MAEGPSPCKARAVSPSEAFFGWDCGAFGALSEAEDGPTSGALPLLLNAGAEDAAARCVCALCDAPQTVVVGSCLILDRATGMGAWGAASGAERGTAAGESLRLSD